MGLDMYLSKKTYVKNWDHTPEEKKHKFSITVNGEEVDYINKDKITHIEEEAAYWRKANQIHQWFVDNIQGGVDNCAEYLVSIDQIGELVDTCELVLQSLKDSLKETKEVVVGHHKGLDIKGDIVVYSNTKLVDELLPPSQGFFFGSTEIGDMYLDDLQLTIDQLKPLLDIHQENKSYWIEYYYSASW